MTRNLILPFVFVVFLSISFNLYSQGNSVNIKDTVKYEIRGTILSKSSNIVTVQLAGTGDTPKENTEGMFSRYFDKVLFGWITIGKMKVTAVNKETITFKILEEKSQITLSGQTQNYFEPGASVKFTWNK